jgi:hypothetical protein
MYYVLCPKCGDPIGPITTALKQPKVTCLNSECNHSFRFDPETDISCGIVSREGSRLKLETGEHLMT